LLPICSKDHNPIFFGFMLVTQIGRVGILFWFVRPSIVAGHVDPMSAHLYSLPQFIWLLFHRPA